MTRKRARHLMTEFSRRVYLKENGTLKGFGRSAKYYRDDWRHLNYAETGGYKSAWNSDVMVRLREMYGM